MHLQVVAERRKRAQILESEGRRQSEINTAEGQKQAQVLASEAEQIENINRAIGEAKAIETRAHATAQAISTVSKVISSTGGTQAVALALGEKYVQAFGELAKKSTTVLLPSNPADAAGIVTQALAVFQNINHAMAVKSDKS